MLALAAVACTTGATGSAGSEASTPAASAAAVPDTGQALAAQSTSLGTILVDGSGRTVYEFANDTNGASACTGGCAGNWPPVPAPATLPTSLPGVTGQLGATVSWLVPSWRVMAGHPLYTFAGDTGPGQTNGQGKTLDGGLWSVASAAGTPVGNTNTDGATAAPVAPAY